MLLILSLLLAAAAVYFFTIMIIPLIEKRRMAWHAKTERMITDQMDKMFYYDRNAKFIIWLYYILPPVFGLLVWIFFKQEALFALGGVLLGLAIPSLILKIKDLKRRAKLNTQILDAIMILSSSLKGGLSLLQGLEVIMEEMPAPISQEIGLVVRENKMGLNLEDSLKHLKARVANDYVDLMVNSLLVARETGGDLIKVLSRLTVTIRDNHKLKESIRTLTMQGKLQGYIMMGLPFFFVWWVLSFEPQHFDFMLKDPNGKMMVIVAVILQLVGMFLIRKFSIIKV